jgi:hypothetical protein
MASDPSDNYTSTTETDEQSFNNLGGNGIILGKQTGDSTIRILP